MDYPAEFVEQLVSLSRGVDDDATVALQRIADLAVAQLDGCDMAGVTLVHGEQGTTAVFTDEEAPEIGGACGTGHGPCLDRPHGHDPAHRRDAGRRPAAGVHRSGV